MQSSRELPIGRFHRPKTDGGAADAGPGLPRVTSELLKLCPLRLQEKHSHTWNVSTLQCVTLSRLLSWFADAHPFANQETSQARASPPPNPQAGHAHLLQVPDLVQ